MFKKKKKNGIKPTFWVTLWLVFSCSCSTAVVWLDMSSFLEAGNGFAVTDWPVTEFVSINFTGTCLCKFLQCTELLFFKPMSRLK